MAVQPLACGHMLEPHQHPALHWRPLRTVLVLHACNMAIRSMEWDDWVQPCMQRSCALHSAQQGQTGTLAPRTVHRLLASDVSW